MIPAVRCYPDFYSKSNSRSMTSARRSCPVSWSSIETKGSQC
jgi:hypothetical protein